MITKREFLITKERYFKDPKIISSQSNKKKIKELLLFISTSTTPIFTFFKGKKFTIKNDKKLSWV